MTKRKPVLNQKNLIKLADQCTMKKSKSKIAREPDNSFAELPPINDQYVQAQLDQPTFSLAFDGCYCFKCECCDSSFYSQDPIDNCPGCSEDK